MRQFIGGRGLLRSATGIFVLSTFASISIAQSAAQPSRLEEIWDSAMIRMTRQSDAWYEDGDFPKSVQNLRLMRQLWPGDYEVATNLGWMLENIHEWDEALSVYVSFRSQNPRDPDSAWPEANFYYMKKVYAKIPPILEPRLKAVQAPHPNTFRTLAHAYEKLGLLKDAKRVWEALVKITPDDTAAKLNLKRINDKLGGSATGT